MKSLGITQKSLDLRMFVPRGTSTRQYVPVNGVLSASQRIDTHVAHHEIFDAFAARCVTERIRILLASRERVNMFVTPGHTMQGFLEVFAMEPLDWSRIHFFNVVELSGATIRNELSFASYLPRTFFAYFPEDKPFPISNYHYYDGNGLSAQKFDNIIDAQGGFDIGILGIGKRGDIGMVMPGTSWGSRMGKVELTLEVVQSKGLDFAAGPLENKVFYAWSIGMKRIFETRNLFLLAFGEEKKEIVRRAMHDLPGIGTPASMLQKHLNVTVILDEAAAGIKPAVPHGKEYAFILMEAAGLDPGSLPLETRQPFEDVLYEFVDLLNEKVFNSILKGFILPLQSCQPENLREFLQINIFEHYLQHCHEILTSVHDSNTFDEEAIIRLHDLFENGVRVCRFPAVRHRTKDIKTLLLHFLFLNIRNRLSAIGSQERSTACKDLLHTHVFHSNDPWFLKICVETMVEMLAAGEKAPSEGKPGQNNLFLIWFSDVASTSGNIFNLAQILAGVLIDASKGSIELAEPSKRLEFQVCSKIAIAKFVACDRHLAHQFLTYMNTLSQNPGLTSLTAEMNALVMENYNGSAKKE